MSYCFDSGQFNKESLPKRLGNWQVPRWAPTRARPEEMRPNPKPICDMNGHFLPGAPRGTSRCFGHYVGTWDLPRHITRKVAEKLAKEPPEGRFPDWLNLRVQRPPRRRGGKRGKAGKEIVDAKEAAAIEQNFAESEDNETPKSQLPKDKNQSEELDDPLELKYQKEPVDKDGNGPYVPGSLTDTDKRHDSHDLLVQNAIEDVHGPQEDKVDKFWRKVAENASNYEDLEENAETMKNGKKRSEVIKLPSVTVSQNFQFARKMHVGNLEHQPLPDSVGYRNLTKIAEHRDSDIVVKPYAIGWKGYGASGPTCCTKLRVHRPKTCDPKKLDSEGIESKQRPSTSAPELGRAYNKPMSHMDLAICWDFRPNDPKHEPRPPKHIDGSNGSKAPAVFTMVHSPKQENNELITPGHSNPIFNQNQLGDDIGRHSVPYFEKNMTKEKRKDSCDVQYCAQHSSNSKVNKNGKNSKSSSSSRNNSISQCDGIHGCGTPSETSRKPIIEINNLKSSKLNSVKQAWKSNDDIQTENHKSYDINRNSNTSIESYEKTPLAQGKLYQSSPNHSQISKRTTRDSISSNNNNNSIKHKNCISCNGTSKPFTEIKPKEDYKFAFKAGNPNSVQSSNGSQDSKNLKVPKMRDPYTKKSYSILTLAPPFSIWRDASTNGYPEHWRLASVYQHAYKPPEQRRKPLIASVFQ